MKTVAEKKKSKDEVQSGTEADKKPQSKTAKKRSKEFEQNIIRDSATAKARGTKGGKKSGEVRRNQKDAKTAVRYLLDLAAKGQIEDNLVKLGVDTPDRTNMVALQARLLTLAMSGNLDAYRELMKMAGYEPEENRKERESVASERRRDLEVEAKLNALGGGVEGAELAVNTTDEDGHNDVVIYMPKMLDEKECEPEADNKSDTDKKEPSDG